MASLTTRTLVTGPTCERNEDTALQKIVRQYQVSTAKTMTLHPAKNSENIQRGAPDPIRDVEKISTSLLWMLAPLVNVVTDLGEKVEEVHLGSVGAQVPDVDGVHSAVFRLRHSGFALLGSCVTGL